MPPKKRPKGPQKRPRATGPQKRPTKIQLAVDSKGRTFEVGQRVRFDDAVYTVTRVFLVPHPDGPASGKQQIVYFRNRATGMLSQIHTPLVTIVSDGPRKRTTPLSLRERRRQRRLRG